MENKIDHSSLIPLHFQIEQYLRELILQKEYKDGKLLPGELELSKKFSVSRSTLRTAMDRLVREGLVIRKKGIGSYVNKSPITTMLSRWDSFSDEMGSKGVELNTIFKKVSWIYPDEETAVAIGVDTSEKICRLERIKGIDGQPVVQFISLFHPRVGIKEGENFNGKLYEILQNKYNSIPTISNEEIGAMACTDYFSKKLSAPLSVPVLFRKRSVLNSAGKLLELSYVYYRADKFVYTIQIKRTNE